jgi:hypothetical protein
MSDWFLRKILCPWVSIERWAGIFRNFPCFFQWNKEQINSDLINFYSLQLPAKHFAIHQGAMLGKNLVSKKNALLAHLQIIWSVAVIFAAFLL